MPAAPLLAWRPIRITRCNSSGMSRSSSTKCQNSVVRGPNPDYPGLVSERYISENNQRLFYRRWEEFMNANSWADIHVDPVTVNFEGTASLHG